jgi:hypothetical protein
MAISDARRQDGQRSLFDEPEKPRAARGFANRQQLAAANDPVSSHLAAEEFTRSGRRDDQKRALLNWMRGQTRSLTSAEIAAHSGMDRRGVARRLPDLERDGFVERGSLRNCGQTNRWCVTWRARATGGVS